MSPSLVSLPQFLQGSFFLLWTPQVLLDQTSLVDHGLSIQLQHGIKHKGRLHREVNQRPSAENNFLSIKPWMWTEAGMAWEGLGSARVEPGYLGI